MGGRRYRRGDDASVSVNESCVPGACLNGGRCVRGRAHGAVSARGECMCVTPYGGPRCAHYVGQDHACLAKQCVPPAVCVWRPSLNPSDEGTPYCICLEGASCTPPASEPAVAGSGGGGALGGALVALAALLAAVLAALYLIHRRRHGAFVHARLPDNVEINNPMYLAGEDEPEPRANGGNHFANPVYETMYAPHHPPEHNTRASESADGSGYGGLPSAARARGAAVNEATGDATGGATGGTTGGAIVGAASDGAPVVTFFS